MLIAQCTDVWVFNKKSKNTHTQHTSFCSRRACFIFFKALAHSLASARQRDREGEKRKKRSSKFDALYIGKMYSWSTFCAHPVGFSVVMAGLEPMNGNGVVPPKGLNCGRANEWSIYCLVQFCWMTIHLLLVCFVVSLNFSFCFGCKCTATVEFPNRRSAIYLDFCAFVCLFLLLCCMCVVFCFSAYSDFLLSLLLKMMLLLLIFHAHIFWWGLIDVGFGLGRTKSTTKCWCSSGCFASHTHTHIVHIKRELRCLAVTQLRWHWPVIVRW